MNNYIYFVFYVATGHNYEVWENDEVSVSSSITSKADIDAIQDQLAELHNYLRVRVQNYKFLRLDPISPLTASENQALSL